MQTAGEALGHMAKIVEAHYLQGTDDQFERAIKNSTVVVQDAMPQRAVGARAESRESAEVKELSDLRPVGAGPCEELQNAGMPLVGLEPTTL